MSAVQVYLYKVQHTAELCSGLFFIFRIFWALIYLLGFLRKTSPVQTAENCGHGHFHARLALINLDASVRSTQISLRSDVVDAS